MKLFACSVVTVRDCSRRFCFQREVVSLSALSCLQIRGQSTGRPPAKEGKYKWATDKSVKMIESDIAQGLQTVRDKIKAAVLKRPQGTTTGEPRLVAVSKIKPKEYIIAAYNLGQRHFGENYVQELVEKSHDSELQEACPEICWHLIGHLQSNKVNKVAQIPNLHTVESVDSEKLATALNNSFEKFRKTSDARLKVMAQVNTSGEKEKNGCTPEAATGLVQHIIEKCPCLEVVGLMTIGMYDFDTSTGLNPDFLTLLECRKEVASKLGIDEGKLEVSMGMSTDYEMAIEMGSTNVRVGTAIFGARQKKKE